MKLTQDLIDQPTTNYYKMLQDESVVKNLLPQSFIINAPMNRVGGDGYLVYRNMDYTYVILFDCSGHGHMASMMTRKYLMCLRIILESNPGLEVGKVLDFLHDSIKEMFHSKGGSSMVSSGADIGVVRIDREKNIITYASARSPILIGGDKEVAVKKLDRVQVGEHFDKERKYTTESIQLRRGESVKFYLFSDGAPDLFGGPDNKKLRIDGIKSMVEANIDLSMDDQKSAIQDYFSFWKGANNQLDDLLFFGFEFSSN
ncbi:MAG: SpoIIE family protein phosphatase [bacterium]|nr:SpoIIE family protein phosphatase [bacterium]